MSDLISRAAAIDELNKGAWGVEWDKTLAKTMIESLPSAQPTQNTRVNSSNALDTISRAAAIDEIKALYEWHDIVAEDRAIEHFKKLPSAQPEIIRCKDCMWYGRADKRRFYRGMDCLQHRIDTIVPDKDFCSRAERRTDERSD